MATNPKTARRLRVRRGIRKKITGTPERPRLSVYRSNRHIYAQLIDDWEGHTLAAASSNEDAVTDADVASKDVCHKVGQVLAERAKEKGIEHAVFDRGGYKYHGRVKALAEGAREGGLQF